tara:strand:- start:635 stop:1468 length:834 start_codon:yes stop_codon:yes gene_type:complete
MNAKAFMNAKALTPYLLVGVIAFLLYSGFFTPGSIIKQSFTWKGFDVISEKSDMSHWNCVKNGECGAGGAISYSDNLEISSFASAGGVGGGISSNAEARVKIIDLSSIERIYIDVSANGVSSHSGISGAEVLMASDGLGSSKTIVGVSIGNEKDGSIGFGGQLIRIEDDFVFFSNGDVMEVSKFSDDVYLIFRTHAAAGENRHSGSSTIKVVNIDITRKELSLPDDDVDDVVDDVDDVVEDIREKASNLGASVQEKSSSLWQSIVDFFKKLFSFWSD